LAFATYFKSILGGTTNVKLVPLLEFATGIEASQIIVVLIALIACYCVQTLFRFSKRDWTLVMASFVIGVVLPMIIESKIWIR
jgi:multisubunit Na+/H+ antiporter MnhB subunit